MLPDRREELELFKNRINLTEYASTQEYVLDRKHSSSNSVAMRGPAGDRHCQLNCTPLYSLLPGMAYSPLNKHIPPNLVVKP
jgi:hypothetical protein